LHKSSILLTLRFVKKILKQKTMKKFLAIVAIAAFMTACNNSASTDETKTDSTVVTTPTDSAAVTPTDSATVNTMGADSTHAADSSKAK